jgi:putative two-component system response regulator
MAELLKPALLVVDDEEANIDIMLEILGDDYDISVAMDGPGSLESVTDNPPDLILLDIIMPGMDGYEVCRKLKADKKTRDIPVIFVTTMSDVEDEALGFNVGAVDYITKPVSPPIVRSRVKTHLALYDQNRVLEEKVRQRTKELIEANSRLERSYVQTVELSFDLLNFYDDFLGSHCKRVAQYSNLIAQELEFGKKERRDLLMASLLHDIGLAGVPSKELIRMHSGQSISSEILSQYNQHPLTSAKLLSSIERFSHIADIIAAHHEHMDGSGFPLGLDGDAIPIESRIIAVVDRYDHMSKSRTRPSGVGETLSIIGESESAKYDGHVLDTFKKVLKKGDPFSRTGEIDFGKLRVGITLAKPIESVDGITLLSTGTVLREDHLDIIRQYGQKNKLKRPISVYT